MHGIQGDGHKDRQDHRGTRRRVTRAEQPIGTEPEQGRARLGQDHRAYPVGRMLGVEVDQERTGCQRGEKQPLATEGFHAGEHEEHGHRGQQSQRKFLAQP